MFVDNDELLSISIHSMVMRVLDELPDESNRKKTSTVDIVLLIDE